MIESTTAAHMAGASMPLTDEKSYRPSVNTRELGDCVRISGNRNPFQAFSAEKTRIVAMPPRDSGSTRLRNVRQDDAPSSAIASNRSVVMSRIAPVMMIVESGTENAAAGRITAISVSYSLDLLS